MTMHTLSTRAFACRHSRFAAPPFAALAVALACSLALSSGCSDDGGDESTTAGGPTGTSSPGTGESSTTTTTSTTTGSDTGTGTEGASESSIGTDTGDTGTTGAPACEITPEDSECDACVETNCCDEVTACLADEDCTCFQVCALEAAGDPIGQAACFNECGVSATDGVTAEIVACTLGNCSDVCQ